MKRTMKKVALFLGALVLALCAMMFFVAPTYATEGEEVEIQMGVWLIARNSQGVNEPVAGARVYLYDNSGEFVGQIYSYENGEARFTSIIGCTSIRPEQHVFIIIAEGFEEIEIRTPGFSLVTGPNGDLLWWSGVTARLVPSPEIPEPSPTPTPTPAQPGAPSVVLNGEVLPTRANATPFIHNGRVMVPIREIGEAFDLFFSYYRTYRRTIVIIMHLDYYTRIYMEQGNYVARRYVTGIGVVEEFQLYVPPLIQNGITFLSLRSIADQFDAEVEWCRITRSAIINTPT